MTTHDTRIPEGDRDPVTVMPRQSCDWTVDDLEQLPDDGLQYELLDGLLLVTPAPIPRHQRAIGRLFELLQTACPSDCEVFFAPLDWQPDRRTSLQPDLLVVRNEDVGEKRIEAGLLLAVEVLSPSTRRKDAVLKRSKYEDAAVASYWIVDPDEPSFLALDLVDGRYITVAEALGAQTATVQRPFRVTVTPDALVAPRREIHPDYSAGTDSLSRGRA